MSKKKTEKRDMRKMEVSPSEAASFLSISDATFYRLVASEPEETSTCKNR